jgi:hypothetical protein
MENYAVEQKEKTLRLYYVTRRKRIYDQSARTYEELVARFPPRHSCQHCTEEIINAFRPRYPLPRYLRNVDQAIKAAFDGCAFYEWLLDFVIRSRPRELVGTERFWVDLNCLPGSVTDVHSVQFMIGTGNYMWPCAAFDVFADRGRWPKCHS